jgi:hypothetical protein
MVSQHERERLTEAFKREPVTGAALVFKCVAGLLVVAALAVIGVQTYTTDATATAANEQRGRMEPGQAGFAIELVSANTADPSNPIQKSSLTQRGAARVNSRQN